MFPKKRNNAPKISSNNNLKKQSMTKSISLKMNNNHLPNNKISKKLHSTNYKKSNSVDKTCKNNIKLNKNDKNKRSAKLYNLTMQRQNSQGPFYSQKNYINDTQLTNINLKYQKLNSHLLSETKAPKIVELINNKINKKKNFLETYNNNANNYKKSKSCLSIVDKKKNLSQGNLDYINFDEHYNYSIYKSSRNSRVVNKKIKKNSQDYNNHKSNKNNKYNKNKSVRERKVHQQRKNNKKNNTNKSVEIKSIPYKCETQSNKMSLQNIKINLNKELNMQNICNSQNNFDINLSNISNNKYSSHKILNKSKTNSILNTSLEDLTQKNKNENNNNNNNSRNNNEIKLIFPNFSNKCDINNESSQESTNQIGSFNSNKYTINNSNINYRKEKFISSFLDGPEDIHCRFVELHKQRKLFYENMCNKMEEDGKSNDNNRINMNEFDKSEYSEYFDNYNENVPLI